MLQDLKETIEYNDVEERIKSLKLCDDEAVMEKVVSIHPLLLQFASETLKNNKAVVKAAIGKNGEAIQHASADLQKDKNFLLANLSYTLLNLLPDNGLRDDEAFMERAVNSDPNMLRLASERLRSSEDFMKKFTNTTKQQILENVLRALAGDLAKNVAFIKAIVSKNGSLYQFIQSKSMKANLEICKAALKNDAEALTFMHTDLLDKHLFELAKIAANADNNFKNTWWNIPYKYRHNQELKKMLKEINGKVLIQN